MTVYICGTSLAILLSLISEYLPKSPSLNRTQKLVLAKVFAFLSFVPLTAIMAVRYGVGSDFFGYMRRFNGTVQRKVEPGIMAIYNLLRMVTDNPQSFFVVTSILICGGYFCMIYRESRSPAFSILLFVISMDYFAAMNGIRQYVATTIAMFAIPYAKNKKPIKVLIILAIASMFHRSAFFYLAMYVLYIVSVPPLVAGIIAVVAFMFSQIFARYLLSFLYRINIYYGYFLSIYQNSANKLNWVDILISVSFLLLLTYEYKKVLTNKNLKLMYSAVLVILFISSISAMLPTNAGRAAWYMNILIILYTPEATYSLNNKYLRYLVNTGIVLAYGYGTIYRILVAGWHGVIPYVSCWMK